MCFWCVWLVRVLTGSAVLLVLAVEPVHTFHQLPFLAAAREVDEVPR